MDIDDRKTLVKSLALLKATVEAGSYTRAAEMLGMTQPYLSKQIRQLEELFRVKLLSPTSRGMVPTHEGQEIYKYAQKFEALFYELENYSLDRHATSGKITLSITDGIGIYLMPHLVEFHKLYPQVKLDIISSYNEVNLKERKSDIAIVYHYPVRDDSLVVNEYHRDFGLFASKDFIAKHGMPRDVDDLLENFDICSRQEYTDNWEEWQIMMAKAKRPVAKFDSSNLLIQSLNCGLGVSLQPITYGMAQDNWVFLDLGVKLVHSCWVVSHHADRHTPKIMKLMEFIRQVMLKI